MIYNQLPFQTTFDIKNEEEGGFRKVFKGSVGFSTLMPSPQIVMRESSSQMHSGHRVGNLVSGSLSCDIAREAARGRV
jgi:hypothetical protein